MQEAVVSDTSMSQNVEKRGGPRCEKSEAGSSYNTLRVSGICGRFKKGRSLTPSSWCLWKKTVTFALTFSLVVTWFSARWSIHLARRKKQAEENSFELRLKLRHTTYHQAHTITGHCIGSLIPARLICLHTQQNADFSSLWKWQTHTQDVY